MKNHKYTHKWYMSKDRKSIRIKRREYKQKIKDIKSERKINNN